MTASPKIKPTPDRVGLDKTSEVFPAHHVASPICLSSFLDSTHCNETIRIEGQVEDTNRIESLITDSKGSEWVSEAPPIGESRRKIEFLIIPNTLTAKNQLEALVKTEKERLSLIWRGANKLPNGKWPKSDTPYYSVSKEKRDDLLRTFKKFEIPQEEIEIREIPVPPPIPKHLKKAQKIQALGDQYHEALKVIETKEAEELADTKQRFVEEDISATDYASRTKEIRDRYAKEKEFLSCNANRNYRAADVIHDDGEGTSSGDQTEEEVVREFNSRFSILENPFCILEYHEDTFSLQKKRDFRDRYQNQKIQIEEKKSKCKADVWLDSLIRNTFFKMEFRPDKLPREYYEGERKYLNLWNGFGITPKQGCCEKIKRHMLEVICGGVKRDFDYLWKLESTWVQHPERRTTVPVLTSPHGAGKGRHVDMFAKIFGNAFYETSCPDHVFGNFNAAVANKVLVHLDDALFGGDKRLMGRLKTFSTADQITIEYKGRDPILVRNPRKLIISSNETFAIPIEPTERRYLFLTVASHRVGDKTYFVELTHEIENGGVEGFLYELLQTDLTEFNPRFLPEGSQGGFENKIESSSTFTQYVFQALKAGTFFLQDTAGQWKSEIRTDLLYESGYLEFCNRRKIHRPVTDEMGGKELGSILKGSEFKRVRRRAEGTRFYSYEFPNLASCQSAFAKHFNTHKDIIFPDDED